VNQLLRQHLDSTFFVDYQDFRDQVMGLPGDWASWIG